MGMAFQGFTRMYAYFPYIFALCFVVILGRLAVQGITAFRQHRKNEVSPLLTVEARLVGRREDVTSFSASGEHMGGTSYTAYYGSFAVESGDVLELRMKREEYDALREGDTGRLTFQGTRFHGFDYVA